MNVEQGARLRTGDVDDDVVAGFAVIVGEEMVIYDITVDVDSFVAAKLSLFEVVVEGERLTG